MDYTSKAGGGSIEALTQGMTELDAIAQSELSMVARLQDAAMMWQQSKTELSDTASLFGNSVNTMMPHWPASTDAPLFREKADASTASMSQSLNAMSGGGGPGTGGVQGALEGLPPIIQQTANDVRQRLDEFNQAIATFNSNHSNGGGGYNGYSGSGVINNLGPTQADLAALVEQVRPIVQAAGVSLNTLAGRYTAAVPVLEAAGAGLRWVGPQSAGTANAGAGDPAAGGGGANGAGGVGGGGAGGAGGGAGGAGDPGLDATTAAAGGAGDATGAGAAGATDGALGTAGGGGAGAGGSADSALPPAGAGGTGLAGGGVDTLPPAQTAIPGGNAGSNISGALPGKPNTTIPPGGLPLLPIGGQQVPPAKATTGIGKFTPLPKAATALGGGGGLGGSGGGGLGGAGLGDARSAIRPATPGGELNQSIPQVAKTLGGPTPSTGQAPVLPGGPGNSLAGTSAGQAGTTMPPPMMPPGGLAGAAGGGRAKAGTGAVRPGSPVRQRPTGPTPGIPAGLRGRTKKDEQAGFPMVPPVSNSKKQRRQTEEIETLQLLDEELWEIEQQPPATSPVAGPTPHRRLAH